MGGCHLFLIHRRIFFCLYPVQLCVGADARTFFNSANCSFVVSSGALLAFYSRQWIRFLLSKSFLNLYLICKHRHYSLLLKSPAPIVPVFSILDLRLLNLKAFSWCYVVGSSLFGFGRWLLFFAFFTIAANKALKWNAYSANLFAFAVSGEFGL